MEERMVPCVVLRFRSWGLSLGLGFRVFRSRLGSGVWGSRIRI